MRGTHAERLLESVFAQFFHSPLSFGNDYTFSAEQIYYRWFSLVPSRDLGKLPHMRFFHTLLLLLNYVYVHCQTSHCVRTKEAKAIMGWAKGRNKNGGWNQKSRRGAMWRLTPQIVSGAAVWIPLPISPIFPEIPISSAIHTGSPIRPTSCASVLENLTAN